MNTKVPYAESDDIDHPVSLYAATKRANELMAHAYAHQYGLPVTGLRFFTVYGPFGRPDMAYFFFTRSILEGKPVTVYREGTLERDFTYVDDIVEGIVRIADVPATPDPDFDRAAANPSSSSAPFRIYNIGNHQSETVNTLIGEIERATNMKAHRVELPMPPGDVERTFADVDDLAERVGFSPATPLSVGIERFVNWYRSYYRA
jgi:UDP-glucuronate 4-epimerase